MSFTFEEFPNSDYYKSDLREILRYIRKITDYLKSLDAVIEELKEGLARLDGIEQHLNELDAIVAELDTFAKELGERVNVVENELDDVERHLSSHDFSIQQLETRLNVLEIDIVAIYQYIDDKYAELEAKHNEDFNLLLLKLNQAKVQLQFEIDILNERIDNIVTDVYNPWMARVVSPQENEEFTYNHLADECLTAEEYCKLGYTAGDYAGLGITSREYQEFGKKSTRFYWAYSPVYGYRQEISNVLTGIVNYLKGTMTAQQYASLDITADEYAQLDLSSEDYYGYNPFVASGNVVIDPNGSGLTTTQYEHLSVT